MNKEELVENTDVIKMDLKSPHITTEQADILLDCIEKRKNFNLTFNNIDAPKGADICFRENKQFFEIALQTKIGPFTSQLPMRKIVYNSEHKVIEFGIFLRLHIEEERR